MVIGLTGACGAGKTTIAEVFAASGMHVINADKIGHKLLEYDAEIRKQLVDVFGSIILTEDGKISRSKLGKLAFLDEEKLHLINKITHPAIIKEITGLIAAHDGDVLLDAALLYQCGGDTLCDKVIFVDADEKLRFSRLLARTGKTEEEVRNMMRASCDMGQFKDKADFVICNNGTVLDAIEQTEAILECF